MFFVYAKTKAQVSCVVIAQLISALDFATSTIHLLHKSKISVVVQLGLCQTWSRFSHGEACISFTH